MAIVLIGMFGVEGRAIRWFVIAPGHVAMLGTGIRDSTEKKASVLLFSALRFGAMPIPNALFGTTLFLSLIQSVFAPLMGAGSISCGG